MWLSEEEKCAKLVGKKILKIFINEQYLKFETDQGAVCYFVEGDCCSTSYFHDFVGVEKLLKNGVVKSFKSIDVIPEDLEYDEKKPDSEYDDSIQVYGYEIVTEDPQFGDVTSVLAFRNSSNGYYGGSMEYTKTIADGNDMAEIMQDWSL